ncbi:MAG: hypothetical protein JNK29_19325, partial [Anaerolineales bacterium]|nr:hypothetical protein [Anaerolineales bacterium]
QQPGLFAAFEVGLWTLDQATARGAAAGPAYLILGDADLAHPTTRLTTALTAGDLRLVNAQGCLAFPARTEAPTVLGMMPGTLPRLRAEFPAAPVTEILNQPEPYVFAALLTVPAGQASVSGQAPALAQVGEAFDLLGVVAPTEAVPAGAAVPLTLRWRARAAGGPVNYTTFVHLLSDQRPFLAGADGEPCQGRYPTSRWHAGEVIEWPVTLTLPADLAAGRYDLAVGMYELASGQRLPVTQAAQREPDRALAAVLTVR